jgi:hypothetical protein
VRIMKKESMGAWRLNKRVQDDKTQENKKKTIDFLAEINIHHSS